MIIIGILLFVGIEAVQLALWMALEVQSEVVLWLNFGLGVVIISWFEGIYKRRLRPPKQAVKVFFVAIEIFAAISSIVTIICLLRGHIEWLAQEINDLKVKYEIVVDVIRLLGVIMMGAKIFGTVKKKADEK